LKSDPTPKRDRRSLWLACRCLGILLSLACPLLCHAQTCAQLESQAEETTSTLGFVADQRGALASMRRLGLEGVVRCPDSSALWYAAIRGVELLGPPPHPEPGQTLQQLIAAALTHVPDSVQVNTVAARTDHSAALARKALSSDAKYRPAQRALAVALALEGNSPEALRLAHTIHPVKEDLITLAKVQLASNAPAKAAVTARLAVASRRFDLVEPTPPELLDREANEVLRLSQQKSRAPSTP
jgi:hypothetical protein